MLDNPWFTVNQRGQSSYPTSSSTYTVDRWRTQTQSNTVNADGSITFSNTGDTMRIVSQSFESSRFNTQFRGKTITISIDAYSEDGDCILGVYNGELTPDYQRVLTISTTRQIYKGTISLPDTIVEVNFDFNIDVPAGAKITIYKAKIEIGSVSTLANDTAPNYATELLKCQRYFNRFWYSEVGWAHCVGTDSWAVIAHLPCVMRAAPTISLNGTISISVTDNDFRSGTPTIQNYNEGGEPLNIGFSLNGITGTVGEVGRVFIGNSYLNFSADI